jgi:hypothetical protein
VEGVGKDAHQIVFDVGILYFSSKSNNSIKNRHFMILSVFAFRMQYHHLYPQEIFMPARYASEFLRF